GAAEAGHRPAPVPLAGEGGPLLRGHLPPPRDEPRAGRALHDLGRDAGQRIHGVRVGWTAAMPPRRKPPAPTTILLVRHGQTPTTGKHLPGRAPGLHLSDAGRHQAEAAAERIAALPRVDAVYASPLERTRETAAPIARARGLRVQLDKGLLECDYGDWTGAELKALSRLAEWKVVQHHPSGFRFPGGESLAEMQTRFTAAM